MNPVVQVVIYFEGRPMSANFLRANNRSASYSLLGDKGFKNYQRIQQAQRTMAATQQSNWIGAAAITHYQRKGGKI